MTGSVGVSEVASDCSPAVTWDVTEELHSGLFRFWRLSHTPTIERTKPVTVILQGQSEPSAGDFA
jgi:hypothetical protein